MSRLYASTDYEAPPPRRLSAHSVLLPGLTSVEPSDRELVLQKALYLSQFLRLFMLIDGVFLVLWAIIAWPFFLGLLLIIAGFYGVKYYNTALSCCYGMYLLTNMALRIYWLTRAHDAFDIVILALGLAVVAYIFYLLCSFVWMVTELRDEERALLTAYSAWDFGYSTPIVIMPMPIVVGDTTGSRFYQQPAMRGTAPPAEGEAQWKEGQPTPPYQGVAGTASPPKAVKSTPRDDPQLVV